MAVAIDRYEPKEFWWILDKNGHEWVKIPTPTSTTLECVECEEEIEDDEYWMSLTRAEATCIGCVG